MSEEKYICWFSNGAASAVAAKIAIEKYGRDFVAVVYCDTSKNEHPDNARFADECQNWWNHTLSVIRSDKFSTIEDVFRKERYMSGVGGARCTTELKKLPRLRIQKPDDIHIFGFTSDESLRIKKFERNNPELKLDWILRDAGITKPECFNRLSEAGIRLPEMYHMGYRNNNCIGCVKSSSVGYWSKIREEFPDVFNHRAAQSREIGCKLLKLHGIRVFLDELPPGRFPYKRENISCGPECGGHEMPIEPIELKFSPLPGNQ